MIASRTIAAAKGLGVALWLAGGVAASAQVTYIPPGGERPRFGGEFSLSQVGPVANYWPTQCRVWHLRAQARRDGPLATPEMAAVLSRFVGGLISEKPNYDDLSPGMAQEVRKNLGVYWPSFNRMGYASAAKRVDKDDAGNDVYVVDQRGGATHWNVMVNGQGKIESAFLCPGQGI
ncbi:MAG TPA: hypothetical protein VG939_01605 [Caulobacteraceae bacterium]|nr:hypothetical protein [Caulobacteraceae bacterium]